MPSRALHKAGIARRCSHQPLPPARLVWASSLQRSEDSRQESLTLDIQPKGTEKARQGYCTDRDQCENPLRSSSVATARWACRWIGTGLSTERFGCKMRVHGSLPVAPPRAPEVAGCFSATVSGGGFSTETATQNSTL